MKNNIILLLIAALTLSACGSSHTASSVSRISSVEIKVSEEAGDKPDTEESSEVSLNDGDILEDDIIEEPIIVPDISQFNEEDIINALLNEDAGVTLKYNYSNTYYYLYDGDKVISYYLLDFSEPHYVKKADVDYDGVDEYIVIACSGHGTGFYINDMYIVKEGYVEPVAMLTAQQIKDTLNSELTYEYNDNYKILTLLNSTGEQLSNLYLNKYLEATEGNFQKLIFGDIIQINDHQGQYWIEADAGMFLDSIPWPLYDYTFNLSMPVFITTDDKIEITTGEITATVYDSDNLFGTPYEEVGEILNELYFDINHDGIDDKLLVFIPEGMEKEDLYHGGYAAFQVYLGQIRFDEPTKSYSEKPILSRTFSDSHAGNGQMFVTTVDGRDYLIETNFWSGQGICSYYYKVLFQTRNVQNVMTHFYLEEEMGDNDFVPTPEEFKDGLADWLNDSSILIYAADIGVDPAIMYSTPENVIKPEEFLSKKY